MTQPVTDLLAGDQFTTHDVTVTILRSEFGTEPWGTPNLRLWCRREDTGEEGFVTFGLKAAIKTTGHVDTLPPVS